MARTVRVRDRMWTGTVTAAWNDSADDALARMQNARLDTIPVVNDQRVVGLLERSAVDTCRSGGNWLGSVPVANLMRRGVFVCRADDTLEHALTTMDRLEIDRLAVVDGAGRVVGVIGRDGDGDALLRLVPALYSSY